MRGPGGGGGVVKVGYVANYNNNIRNVHGNEVLLMQFSTRLFISVLVKGKGVW